MQPKLESEWKESPFIDEVADRQELRLQAGVKATLLLSAEECAAVLPQCVVILLLEAERGQLAAFFPSVIALSWVRSLTFLHDANVGRHISVLGCRPEIFFCRWQRRQMQLKDSGGAMLWKVLGVPSARPF